ncbi:hypothetical protein [Alicyclobacillus sp. SO9]|uniref:hypothetical protein n=1 Tax=Alicyclobacillus sp. SO9 TaxID=2665646 RepID=UPI0018E8A79F|nr:hypothetical protein [Alicyclobacillus sp. SO9]QQE79514.1 hypothetical protein GI364_03185 [Alicyclobacillus sp. SO9]
MRYTYVWVRDYVRFQQIVQALRDHGYILRTGTTSDGTYAVELLGQRGPEQLSLGI